MMKAIERLLSKVRDNRYRCPNCKNVVATRGSFCNRVCSDEYDNDTAW